MTFYDRTAELEPLKRAHDSVRTDRNGTTVSPTRMTIGPLTRAVTECAVAIQRRLRSQGSEIDGSDVLIAATAAESDDSRVLTRNVDKFERVEAIAIETY